MPVAKKETTKKVTEKKVVAKKAAEKDGMKSEVKAPKKATLSVEVVNTAGKVVETISLPEEFFGGKVNAILMAQAVRVYLANQRQGTSSTKTRGEVDGATRKIYRQKGTGRARHGGVRAPIFVKGGIAHGPKPRDYSLSFPKKMRKAALISALSAKAQEGTIIVMDGFTKLEPKTQVFAKALTHAGYSKKSGLLFVMPQYSLETYRAVRNLEGFHSTTAKQLNTYEVLRAKKIVFMKESLAALEKVEEKAEKEQKNA
ncbi:MAG TPA: 50S ribosomal protein L4 [Patescibacteria group bacterium]|nr:50S ribosomal protein L4 [Patescibacteria group bacterium]